jgi:hypothetical protein
MVCPTRGFAATSVAATRKNVKVFESIGGLTALILIFGCDSNAPAQGAMPWIVPIGKMKGMQFALMLL